ncbi:prolyl oligopeptidase family serine peptidase [Chloracidobacterium thermophilum]|jgi:prolyl oligopeptidase|uniref:prolyl oligopeptidase n=2 Tax=Chloracidobacterium thermophilum TaxID=458033 RepID=G2LIE7_CHLTF|nr:prolyl oligopeptidase, Serine peptidase, MEROPS family S09A [Chloracidobacterium thermophilum B]
MFKRQALRRSLVAGTAMLLWTAPLPLFAQNFSKDMKASASSPIVYPPSKKVEQVDDYHGIKVADPYRWLEDADSPETKAWVEAQNKVTFGFLESIPERARLRERLTQLWNYEKFGVPFREGDRYFFTRNDGLQNQSVLYVGRTPDDPQARVLLDPNTLSADGTVALTNYAVSDDGKLLAYGLATAGSDWNEWRVRNVETGEDLPDRLQWVKFSGASWTKDGRGFFYSRYDEPKEGNLLQSTNYYQKLYYHRVGTPQSADELVYERRDHKEWGFGGYVTDDGRYLGIVVTMGTSPKNLFFYKDLTNPEAKVVELIPDFIADFTPVGNDGTTFYFRTDWEAPRGRLIAIDATRPERANWREIIPQSRDTLEAVRWVGGRFIALYLSDAKTQVRMFDREGKFVQEIALPGIGTAVGFGGKPEATETFYAFTSFTQPTSIYRYDFATGKSTLLRQPKVAFDPGAYVTQQVFYKSKDGTRIPMFIVHRKGLKQDGKNPTLLYGYGGFNISLTPSFSPARIAWLEMGGVLAIPNLRGGGEYGEEWHQAGTKLKKQNVFDDFIAAAEWLIREKYTQPARLAIQGGSNGGLLVGACMTQRPELFGAALPAVGVLDMLRFNKFTIGWAWESDYGSPQNPEEFKALYAYSPLHNLKPGTRYPATLITTADHDDRVVPAHSFKFAAALQAAHKGDAPVLIRIETRAGHGAGKPTSKLIEETADVWAFLVRTFQMTVK